MCVTKQTPHSSPDAGSLPLLLMLMKLVCVCVTKQTPGLKFEWFDENFAWTIGHNPFKRGWKKKLNIFYSSEGKIAHHCPKMGYFGCCWATRTKIGSTLNQFVVPRCIFCTAHAAPWHICQSCQWTALNGVDLWQHLTGLICSYSSIR